MLSHKTKEELEAGLTEVRKSPLNYGELKLIVRRPKIDAREVLEQGELDMATGLVGDCWGTRGSSSTADRKAHPLKQITVMNARCIELLAGEKQNWPLAGDQLYVDMNLGYENIPPGTQLALGDAIIEVTEPPHRGCKKFSARFGQEAMRFVNSEAGRELNLRGINAIVIKKGKITMGNVLQKTESYQG